MTREVILGNSSRRALVDDEDYEKVSSYNWYLVDQDGDRLSYAQANVLRSRGNRSYKSTVRMHVLLTGYRRTDHIDHDGLNNRRSNLRTASFSENGANRRANRRSASKYKGVSWRHDRRQWQVRISHNGLRTFLGFFSEEKDAARAYDKEALRLNGAYAWTNSQEFGDLD